MTSVPSVPVMPLLTGAAADHQLDQLAGAPSSRNKVFVPALNGARHAFGVPGRLAPPSARGLRAWVEGTEELRLRLEPFGWRVPDRASLDSAGVVVSNDGTLAIAMVCGDGATGLPGYSPQVKYARGRVAADVVQNSFFDDVVAESSSVQFWFLLRQMSGEGWRAELSRPAGVGKTGWVTGWRARVEIVADGPGGSESVLASSGPELPAPTVRWRESA